MFFSFMNDLYFILYISHWFHDNMVVIFKVQYSISSLLHKIVHVSFDSIERAIY